MPDSGYTEGNIDIFDSRSFEVVRLKWHGLERDLLDDRKAARPRYFGEVKYPCNLKFLSESGRCGTICRSYEATCAPINSHDNSRFGRARARIFETYGKVKDKSGRFVANVQRDEDLARLRNRALFDAAEREAKKRGCPSECGVQMSEYTTHLSWDALSVVDPATGAWKAKMDLCVVCAPLGFADKLVFDWPWSGAAAGYPVRSWHVVTPPTCKQGWKKALDICVYIVSSRSTKTSRLKKTAAKIVDSLFEGKGQKRPGLRDSVKCVPDGCKISWRERKPARTKVRSGFAGHVKLKTIVYCVTYEARCDLASEKAGVESEAKNWATSMSRGMRSPPSANVSDGKRGTSTRVGGPRVTDGNWLGNGLPSWAERGAGANLRPSREFELDYDRLKSMAGNDEGKDDEGNALFRLGNRG